MSEGIQEPGKPANPTLPPQEASPIRSRLLQTFDAEVLDFVTQRLEFAVAEEKIVEQLLRHSFSKGEAEQLVRDLAKDPNLNVTKITDLYEKDLLDNVADQIVRDIPGDAIVRMLIANDFKKGEARRLVDAMVADPELHLRTKEMVSAEIGSGFWFVFSGIFTFLLGAAPTIGMLVSGHIFIFGIAITIALMIFGPVQIAIGFTRIFRAAARKTQ